MGLNVKLKVNVAEDFDSAIATNVQNRIAIGSQMPGPSATASSSDLQGPSPPLSERSGGGVRDVPNVLRRPRSGSAPHLAELEDGTGRPPAPGRRSSPSMRPEKRAVAATAAREWEGAGMSPTGTAGVLANIGEESSFDPTLRHADQPHYGGEAHFAHGLYQEGGAE